MAKNDASKAQNQIDYRGNYAQNMLTNAFQNAMPQNQGLQNRFNVAADQNSQDYGNIMGGYNSFLGQNAQRLNQLSLNPQYKGNVDSAISGYQNFANTGGYSDSDIAALRARAIAPLRSVYDSAQQNIERQKRLTGYSPNYTAATAKLTRDEAQGISDANINVEAALADAIRQGKLAGLSGVGQLGSSQQNAQLGADQQNISNLLANRQQGLSALSGQSQLYGTTPGQSSLYGQLLGQSNANLTNLQQLQNQLAQIIIQGQLGKAQIPSNYQQALGNIGGTLGLAGQVGGMVPGIGGLFNNPGSYIGNDVNSVANSIYR